MLKKLVELGANLEIENYSGATPLFAAVKDGKSATANYLITLGSNVNVSNNGYTAMQYSIINNLSSTASALLTKGCDANARFKSNSVNYTPLYYAVYINKNQTMVTDLLKYGARINDYGMQQWTPLMAAVYSKNTGMVRLLLNQNADPNIKGPNNWTALHFAAREDLVDIANELLKNGAKKRTKDIWNRTPKRVALENDQKTVLKAIKQY